MSAATRHAEHVDTLRDFSLAGMRRYCSVPSGTGGNSNACTVHRITLPLARRSPRLHAPCGSRALHWLTGILASDSTRFEITLCNSIQAMWRIVPSRAGRGKEIVYVAGGVDGTLSLGRYVWQGTSWRLAISTTAGSWDIDRALLDLR